VLILIQMVKLLRIIREAVVTYLDVRQEFRYTGRTVLEFRAEIGIRDFYISDIVFVVI